MVVSLFYEASFVTPAAKGFTGNFNIEFLFDFFTRMGHVKII